MAGEESEIFVASKMKADNKFGQNGYQGASSDLPGEHTTSGFLPQTALSKTNSQLRAVSADAMPCTFGHCPRDTSAKVPTKVSYPSK